MALLLKEKDVEQLIAMPRTLEVIERVRREYSTGEAIDVRRERTRLPKAALHILQGAVPSANVFGYKAYTSSKEGVRFLVYAFDAGRGNLDAIVEANLLGMTRTGAAGGGGAKRGPAPQPHVAGSLRSRGAARGGGAAAAPPAARGRGEGRIREAREQAT